MKPFLLAIFFLLPITSIQAQEKYIVDGQTHTLKTEVQGPLTLLWNTIDGEYRYFLELGNNLVELKNTKENGKYQEEYKEVLREKTADADISTNHVNLTLPSLRDFFVAYNQLKDPNYAVTEKNINLQFRVGGFVGFTNSIYTSNPENKYQPFGGLELEMLEAVKLRRHALVLAFQHTFENAGVKYSASRFSLNYRFKFIKSPRLEIYVNAKFAALTFQQKEIYYMVEDILVTRKDSGNHFNAPLTFGIGADYRVGNGYITFGYNDIVSLNMDSNKEFPIDFSLGYKFNL